jgi:hypothetical protein
MQVRIEVTLKTPPGFHPGGSIIFLLDGDYIPTSHYPMRHLLADMVGFGS